MTQSTFSTYSAARYEKFIFVFCIPTFFPFQSICVRIHKRKPKRFDYFKRADTNEPLIIVHFVWGNVRDVSLSCVPHCAAFRVGKVTEYHECVAGVSTDSKKKSLENFTIFISVVELRLFRHIIFTMLKMIRV